MSEILQMEDPNRRVFYHDLHPFTEAQTNKQLAQQYINLFSNNGYVWFSDIQTNTKTLVFHKNKNGNIESKILEQISNAGLSDNIICCFPETLSEDIASKHFFNGAQGMVRSRFVTRSDDSLSVYFFMDSQKRPFSGFMRQKKLKTFTDFNI